MFLRNERISFLHFSERRRWYISDYRQKLEEIQYRKLIKDLHIEKYCETFPVIGGGTNCCAFTNVFLSIVKIIMFLQIMTVFFKSWVIQMSLLCSFVYGYNIFMRFIKKCLW